MKRCLISVSDKTGLETLVRGVLDRWPDCQILSTGGTAARLAAAGFPITEISDFTGFPECFEGRLKTLHPKVHGGILMRRGEDEKTASELGIGPIDLVVVNLYPFSQAYTEGDSEPIESIDIGGPTLLRAAAKNSDHVVVLCRPCQYREFLERLQGDRLDRDYRDTLRAEVFSHTAAYDASIAAALSRRTWPQRLTLPLERLAGLRYGENPHQPAAVYRLALQSGGLPHFQQRQGPELSYNNLLDLCAAVLPLSQTLSNPSLCCVVKHAAPCGLAVAEDPLAALELAWSGDPVSAFGSVVSFRHPVEEEVAERLVRRFVEVVVAPDFSRRALEILASKSRLRLVAVPPTGPTPAPPSLQWEVRVQQGLALLQQADRQPEELALELRCGEPFEDRQLVDFGLMAVRLLKSNAIALVRRTEQGLQTVGLGGGQPNRVQALRLALQNARQNFSEEVLSQSLLVSDAFFPFPDNIEAAAAAGIRSVLAPGGSKKDDEVVAAASRLGVSLTFVNRRFFRH